jgi:hypothetical protein
MKFVKMDALLDFMVVTMDLLQDLDAMSSAGLKLAGINSQQGQEFLAWLM